MDIMMSNCVANIHIYMYLYTFHAVWPNADLVSYW